MERGSHQEKGAAAQSIIHLPIPERLAYASRCEDSSILFSIIQSFALDYIRCANNAQSERIEELLSPYFGAAPLVDVLSRMRPDEELRALALIWSIPGLASTVHPGHADKLYKKIGSTPEKYHQLYAEAAPDESIMLASCFSDLLSYAHEATQIRALLNILPEHCHDRNKPVLANKIFLEGCDSATVRSWAVSDGGFYAEPDLSRRFDCVDVDCSRIRRIAKDAVALLDTNSSIIATARVPPSSFEGVRNAPKSSSLRYLLEYYSCSGQESMQYNMEDAWETYSVDVAPYLSHADRAFFESIDRSSLNVEAIVSRLEQLLQEADYTRIQFSYLFSNPSITSVQDVHEQVYFSQIHRSRVRASIEDDLRLSFNDLTLREQHSLLTFISSCHETVYENVCAIIKRFGPNAARTFLALESDAAHGERILAFAQQAKPEVATRVFEAFARIADKIDLSAQELAQQLYHADKARPVDAERVRSDLIQRGGKILLEAETSLKQDPTGTALLRALEKYEADTVLFCVLAKQAQMENGKRLSLEQLQRLTLRSFRPSELEPQEKRQALESYTKIAETNWCTKGKYTMATVLDGITHGFTHQDTEFFEMRFDDEVAAFLRLEKVSGTTHDYYIGSYNLHPKMRDSRLGQVFYHQVIATFMERHPNAVIRAHALATDPIVQQYITEFGFRIDGFERDTQPDGTTTPWYRMTIEPKTAHHDLSASPMAHQGSLHHPASFFAWIEAKTRAGYIIDSYMVDRETGVIRAQARPKKPQTTALQTSRAA